MDLGTGGMPESFRTEPIGSIRVEGFTTLKLKINAFVVAVVVVVVFIPVPSACIMSMMHVCNLLEKWGKIVVELSYFAMNERMNHSFTHRSARVSPSKDRKH